MNFCPQCGKQLNDDARFCNECGTMVETQRSESQSLGYKENIDKGNVDNNEPSGSANSSKSSGLFFWIIIAGIFGFIIFSPRFLCDINPYEEYNFLDAIWHGLFIIPNWIYSQFSDVVYKAENQSGIYNFFFWASAICVLGYMAIRLITFIIGLFTRDDKKE